MRDGGIAKTFAAELHALSMFPEDEDSIRQARLILCDEQKRLEELGASEYEPSELCSILMHSRDRQDTPRATTALVALAMVRLDDLDEKMSLQRASSVISEYSFSDNGTQLFKRTNTGLKVSNKSLTGDASDIRGIFRKYRSIAHILAAEAALTDYHKPSSGWTGSAERDKLFLSTVLYLQDRLSKAENFSDWNAWWIELNPKSERENLPDPAVPKADSLQRLFAPWIAAGKPIA